MSLLGITFSCGFLCICVGVALKCTRRHPNGNVNVLTKERGRKATNGDISQDIGTKSVPVIEVRINRLNTNDRKTNLDKRDTSVSIE